MLESRYECIRRLATPTASKAALHLFELRLELLNLGVRRLKVLVEAVSLGDELLLPLSEALLLNLNLLGETLAQSLFLLLVLGVVQLARSGFAELAGLHLLGTVGFVVEFLRCVDEIQHVGSDHDRTQLLEIAVFLVLNLSNTPRVLSALDNATIGSLHVLLGADHGEWHGSQEASRMLGSGFIVLLDRWLVDLDVLGLDDGSDLGSFLLVMKMRQGSDFAYLRLELSKISWAQSIGLGNDRNKVNSRAESLHNFNIQRLQSVASRADKVQASMDTKVNLILTTGLLLLKHVRLMLIIQEFNDGHPRIPVVDIVAKSRSVDNS